MSLTIIDTNKLSRVKSPGSGEFTEILSKSLCGAENVVAALRWLVAGESLDVRVEREAYQLFYVMDGEGTITLNSKDYAVRKGSGLYLAPSEFAKIRPVDSSSLKLLHLSVPKIQS